MSFANDDDLPDCPRSLATAGRLAVPLRKITSLEQFESYLEDRPAHLGCWRGPQTDLLPTLAWLNVQPVVELRELARDVGPIAATATLTGGHHNQVGIAAAWTVRYLQESTGTSATAEQDRHGLWNAAAQYWAIRNAIVEVRVGVRQFDVQRGVVRLPYVGNHVIDSLDRMLDLVTMLEGFQQHQETAANPRLREWMRGEGLTTEWAATPEWVRDSFRTQATRVVESSPQYLPNDATLAGFTVRELDAFWCELLARGMHVHTAQLLGSVDVRTIVPVIGREAFVEGIAQIADISPTSSHHISELLTLDLARCPDPALTPLVSVGQSLLPMSSLIMPTSPHRNALAIAQADPNLVGDSGRLLGLAGERAVVAVLERLSEDSLVATRIKVTRRNGLPAGDLDVVACSPSDQLLAIFEIKWHIAADGNLEVYKADRAAIAKRAQVLRLRAELEGDEATVRWPQHWPDVNDFEKRWFVLTHDVLPTQHVDDDGVTLRSHQLLSRTLRKGSSVSSLVKLLDRPPAPPAELFATEWQRFRYGDVRVEIESLRA